MVAAHVGLVFDWAAATLPADGTEPPGWSRYLLARRSTARNAKDELELAYYLCCAPAGTPDRGADTHRQLRWAVEECFQSAKNETGLDHYQVRRYDAWYRHVTLALLAHAYLCVTAATAPKSPGSGLIPVTLGEVRRLLAHLITKVPGRAAAWASSNWRRHHQHRARVCHYQRRQANYNEMLLSY